MHFVKPISVDVMIAVFLQAEVNSPRFSEPLLRLLARDHQDRRILDEPDVNHVDENIYRARLLGEWRGYGQNADVFTDLPDDTQWVRAMLNRSDMERVKYINDDYWTGFSGGSRFVRDAVARIQSGEIDSGEAACYHEFAKAIAAGAQFTEVILLYNPRTEELVVMEGHIRLTSYLLWAEAQPVELTVLLGISERMQK
jgi:hypothetical protein